MRKILLVSIFSVCAAMSVSAFASQKNAIKHEIYLLQRHFKTIDVKHNGKISKDELNAYFAKRNKSIDAKIAKLEKKATLEKDLNKKNHIKKHIQALKSESVNVDNLMETFDLNKDGYITKAEISMVKKQQHISKKGESHKKETRRNS